MKTLDLHGVRHSKVELIVENFVLLNDTPLRIITGNSPSMKALVRSVLKKHNLIADYENHFNLGALIIMEGHTFY